MKIGIVGIGYWGPNLLRNLNENKKFKVRYICDLSRAKLNNISLSDDNIELALA